MKNKLLNNALPAFLNVRTPLPRIPIISIIPSIPIIPIISIPEYLFLKENQAEGKFS